jgi:DNA (cytosine-5)-methyltransferase 1
VSLFSGVGGFELGFCRAGISTVLQVEKDPWCRAVLERHWPEVQRIDEVRSVRVREPADLVYGGFPCQDVSVAGKRAGLRGERSGLWHAFRRVLSELRPRWTVVENVPGLLSSGSEAGADFGVVLRGLVELGYGVAWRVLDARWFGVPQRRRRVFIVGCAGDARRAAQVLAVCESCGGHPQARREAGQDVAPTVDDGARRASVELPMTAFTLPASARGTGDGHGNAWNSNYVAATLSGGGHSSGVNLPGRHHEDDENLVLARGQPAHRHDPRDPYAEPCCLECCDCTDYDYDALPLTNRQGIGNPDVQNFLVASPDRASDGHHGYSSGRGDGVDNLVLGDSILCVRRLTPLECERLQGWPDEHTRWTADGREIADAHRYRMIGNGVVAPVAEWLGHRLVHT